MGLAEWIPPDRLHGLVCVGRREGSESRLAWRGGISLDVSVCILRIPVHRGISLAVIPAGRMEDISWIRDAKPDCM